jgi:predicted DNA-binding transcriptional regulator AlpA
MPDPDTALVAPEFLNEHQASHLLCQSVRTLQKWRVVGGGPVYHKFGRSVRYSRAELTAWIEARRKAHTSQ